MQAQITIINTDTIRLGTDGGSGPPGPPLCASLLGGDQGYTPEIMGEILTTARDLELEVNEDDIEELIMGHEDELTTEELQEILNEEHQETQRNVSRSE
ncbi:hypothetical protein TNCV_4521791 [Trichonephila clavipes]|nr:hypothetical protein TNCV_4521791 [Trichonephila clavipes]